MLQIFRVNQLLNSLLLFPYALLLNHRMFFAEPVATSGINIGILSNWLETMNLNYPISSAFLFVLLIFIQAILINRMSIIFRMGNEIALFPGLIFILLTSFFPAFQILSGLIIGQFFLILALYNLFDIYNRHKDNGYLFNCALWLALASLIYFPFIIFIPVMIIGGFVLKSLRMVDFLLMINGFIVPYFLTGTYFYLKGDLVGFISSYLKPEFGLQFPIFPLTVELLIPLMLIVASILIVLLNFQYYTSRKGLRAKKNIDIIYWLLLFYGISIVLFPEISLQHMVLIAVPLAFLLQDSLLRIENPLTAEIVHLFLISSLFFFHYQNLFS
ncbi:MAG: hypothetical protein EA362_13245 [Saprospirales bacterium]|nr:MAG: hypothetical protein EA362_13245 [Saprospirales bacterium]